MAEPFLRITLTSNAQAVVDRLDAFPRAMLEAIAKTMDKQNELTIGHAQERHLSGPRPDVLGVVTNRLRSSLRRNDATIEGNSVDSAIGTNVEYAAIHEFGFKGEVTVKAHTRRVFAAGRSRKGERTVIETPVYLTKTGKISRTKKKVRYVAGSVSVRAHTRKVNMPERSFIRSSITERAADYSTAISEAIVAAWQGGPN